MSLNKIYTLGKNQSPQVVLLHAESDCYPLINTATTHLKELHGNECNKYSFNADRYFAFETVINLINENDLFNPNSYIEINFATKPTLEKQKELVELLKLLRPNIMLVIITSKLAYKEQNAAWINAIKSRGLVFAIDESDAKTFVEYTLNGKKIHIDNNARDLLISQNSGNLSQLHQEASKLLYLHTENSKITINDIENIDNSNFNVFQLSNAYLSGDLKKSMKILDEVYQDTEASILIMWMINEDLKKLIGLKESTRNSSFEQAISSSWIRPENIAPLKAAHNRVNYKTLLNLLDMTSKLDMSIKGLMKEDVRMIITQIIMTYCNPK